MALLTQLQPDRTVLPCLSDWAMLRGNMALLTRFRPQPDRTLLPCLSDWAIMRGAWLCSLGFDQSLAAALFHAPLTGPC
eukprot:358313-Chlamydomonas_euryale.AAC.14